MNPDLVNHPPHYSAHPSGVECIVITEHMGFNVGNAVKYLWRCDLKTADGIEDLRKAGWYVNREITRRLRPSSSANQARPPIIRIGPSADPEGEATEAEKTIARAWVDEHRWTNRKDADVEYSHVLKILIFARHASHPVTASGTPA